MQSSLNARHKLRLFNNAHLPPKNQCICIVNFCYRIRKIDFLYSCIIWYVIRCRMQRLGKIVGETKKASFPSFKIRFREIIL